MGFRETGFYEHKLVVVTGGAGFVGSHLVDALLNRGAHVVVVDDNSRGKNVQKHERLRYHAIDAGDPGKFKSILNEWRPFAVFNLAATVAGVLYNQTHNAEMFESNMRLQSAPVTAAKQVNVPHFLQVSSVCVYAPGYNSPCVESNGHEGEPVGANSGYAWAKRMGERIALWSDLPHCVIVRPSNIYGPRDYFDDKAHVIPALIRKCIENDMIEVHGTGEEVREFIHVADVAQGMLSALEFGKSNDVYNIGTNGKTKHTIGMLTKLILHECGMSHKEIVFKGGNSGDEERWSDATKLIEISDWHSEVPTAIGIRDTIKWYQHGAIHA